MIFSTKDSPLKKSEIENIYASVLENLQGNILKGHNRHYANHILVELAKGRQREVKQWLKEFASWDIIKTAKQQLNQPGLKAVKEGVVRDPLATLLLSADGYSYLGYENQLSKFEEDFQRGMKRADLNDDQRVWDETFKRPVHLLCGLADDDVAHLNVRTQNVLDQLTKYSATSPVVEKGAWNWLGNMDVSERREHFGYVDGHSNPMFFEDEIEKAREEEAVVSWKWDPGAGPNLVCVPDPLGEENAFGSYVVFRKLEQNVEAFFNARLELAKETGMSESLAGANIVGRFEDGTALINFRGPASLEQTFKSNNFDYANMDPSGHRCPVHSHIRKVNPRGTSTNDDDKTLALERTHRVVRRGIPYGKRAGNVLPSKDVGLLFVCYQASIRNQFHRLQSGWANDSYFPAASTGVDPITGQLPQPEADITKIPPEARQVWRMNRGNAPTKHRGFPSVVTCKGGDFCLC